MSTTKTRCEACSAPLGPGNKFCGTCGIATAGPTPEPTPAYTCHACKAKVEPDHQFCGDCGAALDDVTDTTRDGHTETTPPVGALEVAPGDESDHPEDRPAVDPVEPDVEPDFGILRIVSQEEFGREVPLRADVMRIGKERDADLAIPSDCYMSHVHARIVVRDGNPEIEDLGSRNGTFVQVRDRCRLNHGDRILIGATVLEYREPARREE